MYSYKTVLHLHHTDAAGILFFSHQFELMHDAYEALLEKVGFGFPTLIAKKPYFLPIVHAEADYKAPLYVGDQLTIQVTVANVGTTSFTFVYTIFNQAKKVVGTGKTVHVTIDKKTRAKIPLPAPLRKAILKIKD